jgi:hypothetical protein
LIDASSPASQSAPVAAIGISQSALGCGTSVRSRGHASQMSHIEIGGTTNPCANVPDRAQISAILSPVPQYQTTIHASVAASAGHALRQATTDEGGADRLVRDFSSGA